MSIETVTATALKPTDVLVRIRAAGLCHTDLEVIEGSLRYPLPIVLGHGWTIYIRTAFGNSVAR